MRTFARLSGPGLAGLPAGRPDNHRLNENIDSLLCNLTSAFNPLHRDCLLDYQVKAINSGEVCMSVILPNEMLLSFSTLLESMGGFFRAVNNRARSVVAEQRLYDLDQIQAQQAANSGFRNEVCTLFDDFIHQGLTRNEAIKRVNSTLKGQNSPWASWDIITSVLRSEGRFRRSKGVRGGEQS